MHIYKITNLINGKIYVGKEKGNDPNYFGSGFLIQLSIRKHGIENFKKEILEECSTFEEMWEREIYWIKLLNSTDLKIGYNLSSGGIGGCDSQFVKDKISVTVRNLWLDPTSVYNSPEYRINLSNALKKVSRSPYHIEKIIKFLKENPPWKGKKLSEEHKKNIGDGVRGDKNGLYGKWLPHMEINLIPFEKGHEPWNKGKRDVYKEETLAKMSESAKNRTVTEESRESKRRKLAEQYKDKAPSWATSVLDTRDGSFFKTAKEFRNHHKITEYKYKQLMVSGLIIVSNQKQKNNE